MILVPSIQSVSNAQFSVQLLHANKWSIPDILAKFTPRVSSPGPAPSPAPSSLDTKLCSVCAMDLPSNQFTALKGKHWIFFPLPFL